MSPSSRWSGWASFAGLRVAVEPGVFVPRRRSELRRPGRGRGHRPRSWSTCAVVAVRSAPRSPRAGRRRRGVRRGLRPRRGRLRAAQPAARARLRRRPLRRAARRPAGPRGPAGRQRSLRPQRGDRDDAPRGARPRAPGRPRRRPRRPRRAASRGERRRGVAARPADGCWSRPAGLRRTARSRCSRPPASEPPSRPTTRSAPRSSRGAAEPPGHDGSTQVLRRTAGVSLDSVRSRGSGRMAR